MRLLVLGPSAASGTLGLTSVPTLLLLGPFSAAALLASSLPAACRHQRWRPRCTAHPFCAARAGLCQSAALLATTLPASCACSSWELSDALRWGGSIQRPHAHSAAPGLEDASTGKQVSSDAGKAGSSGIQASFMLRSELRWVRQSNLKATPPFLGGRHLGMPPWCSV